MTKDGRDSRLSDIRLFAGAPDSYLEGFAGVVAFARRMAWLLNGEDFSIGAHTHLYLFFSPTTPLGAVHPTDMGAFWWFRYTCVGAPRELIATPENVRFLEEGIIAALKANRPDKASLVDDAAAMVRTHGNGLRFLLKIKDTRTHKSEVAFTIGEWKREPTEVRVLRTDKQTGALFDAPPIPIIMAEEARRHVGEALGIPAADYRSVAARPAVSKLVKFQGLAGAAAPATAT